MDRVRPWLCFKDVGDLYALQWETTHLLALGRALKQFVMDAAVRTVAREILTTTVLASLLSAIVLPASVLRLTNFLDNEWAVAMERAQRTGEILVLQRQRHIRGRRKGFEPPGPPC